MYGYISGIIKDVESNYIIIDNNGIGYLIYVPNPYYYTLNEIYTQAVKIGLIEKRGILTVFVEKPQHGKIYQCGNHEEGEWEVKGKTKGMHEIKLVINIGDGLLC